MEIVTQCHQHLFSQLPERSRFQRAILDARELIASFGLSLSLKEGYMSSMASLLKSLKAHV